MVSGLKSMTWPKNRKKTRWTGRESRTNDTLLEIARQNRTKKSVSAATCNAERKWTFIELNWTDFIVSDMIVSITPTRKNDDNRYV